MAAYVAIAITEVVGGSVVSFQFYKGFSTLKTFRLWQGGVVIKYKKQFTKASSDIVSRGIVLNDVSRALKVSLPLLLCNRLSLNKRFSWRNVNIYQWLFLQKKHVKNKAMLY